MDEEGIQVHVCNVLFHQKYPDPQIQAYRSTATEQNHAIVLPLRHVVEEIAQEVEFQLIPELEKLFPLRDSNRKISGS